MKYAFVLFFPLVEGEEALLETRLGKAFPPLGSPKNYFILWGVGGSVLLVRDVAKAQTVTK